MKYLLIADVHANTEALDAVLYDSYGEYEGIICLGDLIDYGAEPNKVIEKLRNLNAVCLMGNHDAAAVEIIGTTEFNEAALDCVLWSMRKISKEHKTFLKSLQEFLSFKDVFFVHGTPMGPLWNYLEKQNAQEALDVRKERMVVTGHSHIPFYYNERTKEARIVKDDETFSYEKDRIVVTIPSVGQPRDKNPKSGYALWDPEKKIISIKRVCYDIESAANKILEAKLPKVEATRLYKGDSDSVCKKLHQN